MKLAVDDAAARSRIFYQKIYAIFLSRKDNSLWEASVERSIWKNKQPKPQHDMLSLACEYTQSTACLCLSRFWPWFIPNTPSNTACCSCDSFVCSPASLLWFRTRWCSRRCFWRSLVDTRGGWSQTLQHATRTPFDHAHVVILRFTCIWYVMMNGFTLFLL